MQRARIYVLFARAIEGADAMRTAGLGVASFSVLVGTVVASLPALAQMNQLEIREPKVEAGEFELEYLGDYNFNPPRRRFLVEPSGSLLADDNDFSRQRHTLGLGYGLTRWLSLQLAVEAEEERLDEPGTTAGINAFGPLKVTEIELEATVVLVPARKEGWGVAALIEHNVALDRRETDQLFLGSALQYASGPWTATANLYAVRHFGGREELDGAPIRDERWDFQYAAQLKYRVNEGLALALEGYGVVERLGHSGTKSEERERFGDFDRHLLGPVIYYSWGNEGDRAGHSKSGKGLRVRAAERGNDEDDKKSDDDGPRYTVGAGVLFGLNDNTSNVALKWALSVEF
jgi:hypothetical protein